MLELNPFHQHGALRNRSQSTSIPKRSDAEKARAVKCRHRIEDHKLAREMGMSLKELLGHE